MNAAPSASAATPTPLPIDTAEDAEKFVVHLMDVMDALLGVLEEETAMVRAGRLSKAAELSQPKADLTRQHLADTARLKASHRFLKRTIPDVLQTLHRRHDAFRALLQINLTVLATAHAVSEGIVRGVSNELARKAGPTTYGASGRETAPRPYGGQALAVSRSL